MFSRDEFVIWLPAIIKIGKYNVLFYYLLSFTCSLMCWPLISSLRDNHFQKNSLWSCICKWARRWNDEKFRLTMWLYFIPGMSYGIMCGIFYCTVDVEFEVAFTVNNKAPPLFTVTEVQRNIRQWQATEGDFPELFFILIVAHTCRTGIMVCFSSQGGILCILH